MHKRRAALVEPLVTQLSPQHYLGILQQITFQLGETYNQIYDIKWAPLENLKQVPQEKANKINKL